MHWVDRIHDVFKSHESVYSAVLFISVVACDDLKLRVSLFLFIFYLTSEIRNLLTKSEIMKDPFISLKFVLRIPITSRVANLLR